MAVARADLPEVVEGDDVTHTLTFTDANGDPIDITNYTVSLTVKAASGDDATAALVSVDVTTHTDPTNGITEVTLPSEQTSGVVGKMWYDIQLKRPDGSITTVMLGRIPFIEGITDRVV